MMELANITNTTLKNSSDRQTPLLSHKNHFKFGYDGVPFVDRFSDQNKWWVSYGPCERQPLNFREECLETAKIIRGNTLDPIWVLFSGGVDSEVALRSFVEANIPVSAAILRFKNDLNLHDIAYAVIVCEELKVPYRIYDLDLIDFWENRAFEYATPTNCVSPQLLTTMYLVDQVEGYPVLGSGECLLVKEVGPEYVPGESPYVKTRWDLWEKEKIAAWYRHFVVRGRDGCPGFFQYTAELMLSYLQDPFVTLLVNDEVEGKLSTASSKLKIYQDHFNLLTRPKFTGFEKVQDLDAITRAKLLEAFPKYNETIKTPYVDLVNMLAPRA